VYLHPVQLEGQENVMASALWFLELHVHAGSFLFAGNIQMLLLLGNHAV
jgi:hypothetical protein